MRIGPFTIQRTKAAPAALSPVGGGGWWPVIRESFTGAWQRNITIDRASVMTYGTVWSCVTLIASDISKLWLELVAKDEHDIWSVVENPAFSPVLRKPNHFSTRVKFFEHWMISKLVAGNTYALKERDGRGVVRALYVLDPQRVQVLVAPNGEVFYQLTTDFLSGVSADTVTVPAREIIHDICVPLYHPLVGVSPIHACGLAAMQGLKIQEQSERFFANGSNIGGVLTAPGTINDVTARRIKEYWEANYGGDANIGKIAVLGDGLKFEQMTMTAVDAQLIEQLRWTSENVCACYHVPGYMVGIGPPPPYTDIQSINLQYYTQALQNPIENLETLLDEGLEFPRPYGVQFNLAALARMDTKTQMDIQSRGVSAGIFSPNEARAEFDMKPVVGGESPMALQQQYSLEALARRDSAVSEMPTPSTDPLPTEALERQMSALIKQLEARAVPEPEPDEELIELATAEYLRKALAS